MQLNYGMPILIADDNQMMIQVVRSLVERIGFQDVDESRSGAEALEKLRRKTYGLVISDWNMAPLTGLDLLQEMRSDSRLRNIPFIMITAHAQEANVQAAMNAGAASFIVKPFNMKTLLAKIEQCVCA